MVILMRLRMKETPQIWVYRNVIAALPTVDNAGNYNTVYNAVYIPDDIIFKSLRRVGAYQLFNRFIGG